MIVPDVNVLLALELESSDSALVRKVLDRDADWRLPKLWRWEFGNALRTLFHAQRIPAETAIVVFEAALARYRPCEIEEDESRTLGLAMQRGQTYYDSCYLELAQRLRVTLVTQDKALISASQGIAMNMATWLAQRN